MVYRTKQNYKLTTKVACLTEGRTEKYHASLLHIN